MSKPFVSVIVPVFNDSKRLRYCLASLETQTYLRSAYEVIVVNNNSTENIELVVDEFDQARIAFERRQGSYAARNKGIELAKGNVFAFTDSDCIPAKDWVEKGVEKLMTLEQGGLVGGKITFYFQQKGKPTAAELYDSHNSLQQKNYIEEKKYGATANVFTTRQIFEAVGLFDAQLQSGGDHEWGKRVFDAGYTLAYGEEVEVKHPARDLDDLVTKVIRITTGHFILKKQVEEPVMSFVQELYLDFKPSIKYVLKTLANKQIGHWSLRLRYIRVYAYLRLVRAIKKARLYIGYKRKGQYQQQPSS